MSPRFSFVSSQRSTHQTCASALDSVVVFPDGSVTWVPEAISQKTGSANVSLSCLNRFFGRRKHALGQVDRPQTVAQTRSYANRMEAPIALVSCF